MTRRSTLLLTSLAVAGLWIPTSIYGQQDTSVRQDYSELGAGPMLYVPVGLDKHLERSDAAVVAEVLDGGSVRIDRSTVPAGQEERAVVDGFAVYTVRVVEVLMNRKVGLAPPLAPGNEASVQIRVGRDEAKAIAAKRLDVSPGDQCLLFLHHMSDRPMWSFGPWEAQFRRSRTETRAAEAVRSGQEAQLLGSAMPLQQNGGRTIVEWDTLVKRVAELAAAQAKSKEQ